MLAVAPLRNTTKEHEGLDGVDIHTTFGGGGGGGGGFTINPEEFPEFVDHGSLLESIDFDDLFNDGDVLPDLEIDPDILMDFSGSSSATNNNDEVGVTYGTEGDDKSGSGKGEAEVVSRRDESRAVSKTASKGGSKRDRGDKKRKYSSSGNGKNNKDENNQGKRKVKVDWTPELHRRFVQVVEQLGVDKAVPSRILELMGIDCLTRHNVASHLQKYRSHRKHLLAREAEAASWTHKRHMYGAAAAGGKNGCRGGGWMATTVGFPPPTPPQMMPHHPHYGPLHVWGHPSVDQSLMQNIWPKHLPNSRSPPPPPPLAAHPPIWVPPPPMDPYWHQRVPNRSTPGAPCFAQLLAAPTTRFGSPSVTGIPPPPHHSMYKSERTGGVVGVSPRKSGPLPPADFFPSKESIDAAIGDALTKPWLPLPLGLKPPAVDSVMVELHRHGVSMVPPPPAADDEPKKT